MKRAGVVLLLAVAPALNGCTTWFRKPPEAPPTIAPPDVSVFAIPLRPAVRESNLTALTERAQTAVISNLAEMTESNPNKFLAAIASPVFQEDPEWERSLTRQRMRLVFSVDDPALLSERRLERIRLTLELIEPARFVRWTRLANGYETADLDELRIENRARPRTTVTLKDQILQASRISSPETDLAGDLILDVEVELQEGSSVYVATIGAQGRPFQVQRLRLPKNWTLGGNLQVEFQRPGAGLQKEAATPVKIFGMEEPTLWRLEPSPQFRTEPLYFTSIEAAAAFAANPVQGRGITWKGNKDSWEVQPIKASEATGPAPSILITEEELP